MQYISKSFHVFNLVLSWVVVLSENAPILYSNTNADAVHLISMHGYKCEIHQIITEDGYILTYHRIPYGKNQNRTTTKPPVLLMHGAFGSSENFLFLGPNRSLGFILADLGYDVWLANSRGNAWSRLHLKWDPIRDAAQFFNFSWHEIGYYDLSKAIDYILETNGHEKLDYIGHSQGGTVFLVLMSTRPQYNKKIKLASLLAPAAFFEHMKFGFIYGLAQNVYTLEKLWKEIGMYEVPFISEFNTLGSAICVIPQLNLFCRLFLAFVVGFDEGELILDDTSIILRTVPSNIAWKQIIHFGQLIRNGGFSLYDYGLEKNLIQYGTQKAPTYNLSRILAPVAMYYGMNDIVVNYLDEHNLITKLPNVVHEVLIENAGHIDFVYSKNMQQYSTAIINFMINFK